MTVIPTQRSVEIMAAAKIMRALSFVETNRVDPDFRLTLIANSSRVMEAVVDNDHARLASIRADLRNLREELAATNNTVETFLGDAVEGVILLMIPPVTVPGK